MVLCYEFLMLYWHASLIVVRWGQTGFIMPLACIMNANYKGQ